MIHDVSQIHRNSGAGIDHDEEERSEVAILPLDQEKKINPAEDLCNYTNEFVYSSTGKE